MWHGNAYSTSVSRRAGMGAGYEDKESSSAVPRFTQNSGSMDPDFSSTGIMKEGRSRVPVRTGYMYSGHTYTPRPAFFLFSAGLKCTMGMGQNNSCTAQHSTAHERTHTWGGGQARQARGGKRWEEAVGWQSLPRGPQKWTWKLYLEAHIEA